MAPVHVNNSSSAQQLLGASPDISSSQTSAPFPSSLRSRGSCDGYPELVWDQLLSLTPEAFGVGFFHTIPCDSAGITGWDWFGAAPPCSGLEFSPPLPAPPFPNPAALPAQVESSKPLLGCSEPARHSLSMIPCSMGCTIPRRGRWEESPSQQASISCQHSSSNTGRRSGRTPLRTLFQR